MFRDFKLLRRNSGKNEEPENVPVNSNDLSVIRSSVEPSRAPLNSIQDPTLNPKPEPDGNTGSKVDRTPSKPKAIMSDSTYPLRTPDKHGAGFSSRHKFGWAQKHEPNSSMADLREDMGNYSTQVCRVAGIGTGGLVNMTPKTTRTVSRAASGYTESNSTQSTPTKSVSKPPNSGFRSKVDGNVGSRTANFAALYKGMPISGALSTVVNTVEVPHFDLKEDPSFWMDHNVQVVIRIRPLNSMERSTHGYNRCLKQESSQSITWIGQPETRFTFDHVACETVDQEMLFRMAVLPMVENCLSGYNSCIFAYGQTGSGKTYTMLGEIENLKLKPSPHRGMTPRIFEFLFARIQAEEESRREEKLKYNCKCSFLEIYNEQIADLLDPSSTNLLLREDVKKGVYVENLSEFEVQNVSDILCLITQGSSNRKVAATNMNRESSRSHSVFTCVIESRWEKDSTTNLRFSRLNLVDLAGSERQKTSGAEGERLKEAANINKSLSTLGHAIMVLVDVTNGKPRHVPYRDSRLTFLLQDSLGGNSKTMIIANVSPSISSAAETLNTLKFAQRAKMIQNNAVVNEDSNGDVTALQHQIRLLKDELSILKRQNVSRSLSFGSLTMEDRRLAQENSCAGITCEMDMAQADEMLEKKSKDTIRMSIKQLKYVETTLAGALRREQMAETSIKQLEAEIERLNRLVRQREEDNRCTKMMLRFREDKIQRMESLLSGSFPADTYLLEENRALSEEIQVLQTKLDRNPEVIRFAVENIRLSDQLRRYQEFYEEGEREILLSEVSQLRNQLFQFLDGNFKHPDDPKITKEPQEAMHIKKENDSFSIELENTLSELEECRRNLSSCLDENAKLSSELEDLRSTLNNLKSAPVHQDHVRDPLKGLTLDVHEQNVVQDKEIEHKHKTMMTKHAEEIVNFQLELDILKIILKEERSSSGKMEERVTCLNRDLEQARNEYMLMRKQYEDATNDLKEAKCVIEAIESQQILSINEIDDLRNNNNHCVQLLSQKESEIMSLRKQLALKELRALQPSIGSEKEGLLQQKVNRMQDSIEKAKRMNTWYQSEHECQVSNDEERDEICWQAEAETAAVIVCLQEELAIVQQQLQDNHLTEQELNRNVILLQTELKEAKENLYILNKDNESLREKLEEKDGELTNLSEEWARLTSEIEEVLADGCEILIDASDQLDLISGSFPQKRIWISVHVGKLVRTISEKELLIEDLRRCLEDANNKRSDVECMLKSLKGATLAIAEAHQHECSEKEKEILFLTSDLSARESTIGKLENKIRLLEDQIGKTSVCATVAFVIVNRLSEENDSIRAELAHKNNELHESGEINLRKDGVLHEKAAAMQESEKHILTLKAELEDCKLNCLELRQKLSGEEEQTCAMKEKLEKFEERSILNTREKLVELKTGVSTLRSCTSAYAEHSRSPDRNKSQEIREYFNKADAGQIAIDTCEDTNADKTFGEELTTDLGQCSLVMETICVSADDMDDLKPRRPNQDGCDRGATILLLKKEIECALESLKEVKVEMEMLREEKMQMWHSDKKNQESMKCMMIQVLNLQELMSDFENQTKIKMEAFVQRVEKLERIVLDAGSHLYQSKELIEQEVHDVKLAAAQKAAEVVCILSKFEEAQDTIKEADIVINGLLIANEALKLEVKKLQKMSATLSNDRDVLAKEFQSLQSINSLNIQQIEHLSSDLMETKALTMEMEGIIAGIQNNFEENNMILASDFCGMKSLVFDSSKLVHLWLEDIWSGIIVKDCAVSVLHLCHMGILLETDIGLNAENGLLQHGLQNSNDVIADLREHNVKSRKELDMCRITEGKLLTDIKNSFDRVSRKEKENLEFGAKLSTFEKKILDLQLQEEMILQRSNDMASQLAILMKELDSSNSNFFISFLDEEKLLKDKVEFFQSQMELLMENLCLKDFESLILASELEEMTLHNVETKRKHISHCTVLEYLKRDIYLWKVDAALKEQFSANMEVEVHYHISDLDQQNKKLQKDIKELEILLQGYNSELETKEVQLTRMVDLESENETLRTELRKLTPENNLILPDLEVKNSHLESSLNHLNVVEKENQRLQDEILSVENCLMNLRMDLEVKKSQVQNLEESQSAMLDELNLKIKDFQIQSNSLNELKKDNAFLREEILSLKKSKNESLTILCSNTLECVEMMDKRLLNSMSREVFMVVEKRFQEICETIERTSYFMEEIEYLQSHVKEVVFANRSLQTEIKRKDDVLNGLLFDLSLLQESTSNTKDQKDEIEELISSLETLEVELAIKSRELGEATTTIQMLEVELRDKTYMISDLELNISKEQESCSSLSQQDQELRSQLQDALVAKSMVEEELTEKKNVNESLEMEIFEMGNALDEMNDLMESLKSNLNETAYEKDHLQVKVLALEKKLVTKEARIEENEAKAKEAQQIAEMRKLYAEEKEEEVELLERSIQELEYTINVLENEVNIVKKDADRQRLQREELELELHTAMHQMQNLKNAESEMRSCLDEKEKYVQEMQKHMQILERDIADKDAEIAQFKAHISELNMHAEAQACEYKQKFKALEAMAEQVRSESHSSNITNFSSNKLEKCPTKPRGSGSPFKCIGLGMAQQVKSERDEELITARLRIEELETLAASRQKEIFTLKSKLAAAESMTHDVIRDLLGVKLDMTTYVSLLDNQQVQKITEKARLHNMESQEVQGVNNLMKQLNEFIEERQGWLEEIDRKQAEITAAELALEKLRQQEQFLKTENEMLKTENINQKKKVMQLEGEVSKLSGQQNLQQRIHHHAKIKEENNMLNNQNEDLSSRLRRTELILSRVKEELARFRGSIGKTPHIDFDEENRLSTKLKETEEEKSQLAQKLLSLCTNVLKAAGITKPTHHINPSVAEEALEQLNGKVAEMDIELRDLKYKNKIMGEKIRLSELRPQSSPITSKMDESCQTPRRVSQAQFSALDR